MGQIYFWANLAGQKRPKTAPKTPQFPPSPTHVVTVCMTINVSSQVQTLLFGRPSKAGRETEQDPAQTGLKMVNYTLEHLVIVIKRCSLAITLGTLPNLPRWNLTYCCLFTKIYISRQLVACLAKARSISKIQIGSFVIPLSVTLPHSTHGHGTKAQPFVGVPATLKGIENKNLFWTGTTITTTTSTAATISTTPPTKTTFISISASMRPIPKIKSVVSSKMGTGEEILELNGAMWSMGRQAHILSNLFEVPVATLRH